MQPLVVAYERRNGNRNRVLDFRPQEALLISGDTARALALYERAQAAVAP